MNKAITITSYERVPENDEEQLLKTVANQMIFVGIDGFGWDFKFFQSGGVFAGECGDDQNHAVIIVGYGRSEEGLDY
ncbi:hypothetical protein V6N13_111180 [Hibiscus sabdariffa]|uniref:Peptidase C1A papain C-terminal domain-containing protein n=1 Tax=Hibiscus sabdariffa TaxID=183260 RepID=A0ABR2TJE6_9ROSI